jgi:hypothetical protein
VTTWRPVARGQSTAGRRIDEIYVFPREPLSDSIVEDDGRNVMRTAREIRELARRLRGNNGERRLCEQNEPRSRSA